MTVAAVGEDQPPTAVSLGSPVLLTTTHPDSTDADRQTLCITCGTPNVVLQTGDVGFREQLSKHYQNHENSANEGLITLKNQLRTIHDTKFWSTASSGLGELLGAQYAFICKRLDRDAQNNLVNMGDPGSCILGMSLYIEGHASGETQYQAHGTPCEYMKHNKVLLIPSDMSNIILNNPNQLPTQPEAYMAVPLSYRPTESEKDVVFGHFGVMWTAKGLAEKKLSFPQVENILHSLEDLIVSRFREFGHLDDALGQSVPISVPQMDTSITSTRPVAASSFKPYARSLSHELRTPMQGVVGMLDLMYAAVQEASEGSIDTHTRGFFKMLKEDIEEVHDSARRAVEAADNVVHAYDMNMSVADVPVYNNEEEDIPSRKSIEGAQIGSAIIDGSSPMTRKRRSCDETSLMNRPYKMPRIESSTHLSPRDSPTRARDRIFSESPTVVTPAGSSGTPILEGTPHSGNPSLERSIAPGVRPTVISDTLQSIINDVVKIGGRPASAIAHPVDGGEEIEVRHRDKDGIDKVRIVTWTIDEAVPETIVVDERDLTGLLSRVLHNAFKFTESGSINTTVRLSPKGRYILINVTDTGHGIPKAFMPSLFKAFSKEDDSITRQSEGLGLGLMVAKGLARRMNGDLYAIRSDTEGPNRGSEFEMRIPLVAGDSSSRSSTPYGSRSPSATSMSLDTDHAIMPMPTSPRPQLKRSGPLHHRSGSLLSKNAPGPNSYPSRSSVVSSSYILTPPTTASPVSTSTTSIPTITSSTSQPRVSPPPTQARRNSHNRKTPPYRQAGEKLAAVLPLAFLVVEDNSLLRKVLVTMLRNLGYTRIHQAYDGADALRQMEAHRQQFLTGQVSYEIDFVLMDLWMPNMNGYNAAEHILRNSAKGTHQTGQSEGSSSSSSKYGWKMPIIMAVTADVTDEAMESVSRSGMKGPLTKPYKQVDLERTLVELCGLPVTAPTIAGF